MTETNLDTFMTRKRVYLLIALVAWLVILPVVISLLSLPPEVGLLTWVGVAAWLWLFFVWAKPGH